MKRATKTKKRLFGKKITPKEDRYMKNAIPEEHLPELRKTQEGYHLKEDKMVIEKKDSYFIETPYKKWKAGVNASSLKAKRDSENEKSDSKHCGNTYFNDKQFTNTLSDVKYSENNLSGMQFSRKSSERHMEYSQKKPSSIQHSQKTLSGVLNSKQTLFQARPAPNTQSDVKYTEEEYLPYKLLQKKDGIPGTLNKFNIQLLQKTINNEEIMNNVLAMLLVRINCLKFLRQLFEKIESNPMKYKDSNIKEILGKCIPKQYFECIISLHDAQKEAEFFVKVFKKTPSFIIQTVILLVFEHTATVYNYWRPYVSQENNIDNYLKKYKEFSIVLKRTCGL